MDAWRQFRGESRLSQQAGISEISDGDERLSAHMVVKRACACDR
jgi:hypothetical protein